MRREFFQGEMSRLSALRYKPSSFTGHWDVLQGLPESILSDVVTRLLATQDDFPTPALMLREAEALRPVVAPEPVAVERLETPLEVVVPVTNQRIAVHEVWHYSCQDCSDTGMVSWWCGQSPAPKWWYGLRACERRASHYDHEWVGPCGCVPTNPTIQRRLAARATYAQEAAPVRKGRYR